jgi:hypothetical protein
VATDYLTQQFNKGIDPVEFAIGKDHKRSFTWDPHGFRSMDLTLRSATLLESNGWRVCLEAPVAGTLRNRRIPILALKKSEAIVLDPVRNLKKLNTTGLTLVHLARDLSICLTAFSVRPVVLIFDDTYDHRRRTSDEYEIWSVGQNGLFN